MISVAIPIYNEDQTLSALYERLITVLPALEAGQFELVFCDDGSTDGSRAILRDLAGKDKRVKVVTLSRNFGHQVAITAALLHTSGDAVVVMDGDLQDRPEDISILYDKFKQGFDVVYARRRTRPEGALLRICYYSFYRLLNLFSAVPIPVDSGDFAILSRRVVNHLNEALEPQRFLRGLRAWVGFHQAAVEVDRGVRQHETSRIGFVRLIGLAFDGFLSFSTAPLRVATFLGASSIFLGLLFGVYALYAKLVTGQSPQGFTALFFAVVFFSGVQLLFLGIIGEYIGRIYEQGKKRPLFIIEETLNVVASRIASNNGA